MGLHQVKAFGDTGEKTQYLRRLLEDIQVLERMLEMDLFEKSPIRIGAEQELFILNRELLQNPISKELLCKINDSHFTTEIAKFNLEINLDPIEIQPDCLRLMQAELEKKLARVSSAAARLDAKVLLTGILPTLSKTDLSMENMTEVERYRILNQVATQSRGSAFNIHIQGQDELTITHDSVLLEACNTSFQAHLQTSPEDFVPQLNWANAISGPVLAACCNSPLLFGKELWQETRIALFTQSVDVRASSNLLNESQARVSFEQQWHTGGPADVFKDQIARFKPVLTAVLAAESEMLLNSGQVPSLKALSLHNGTVYRWNRPCYGVGNGKPHLRIECRYLPSGPTIVDEVANLAFWLGLMKGMPQTEEDFTIEMDFRDVKTNFLAAARYGLNAPIRWGNRVWMARDLVSEVFVPMAEKGLQGIGIDPRDIFFYLEIILKRTLAHNGAEWMLASFRNLMRSRKRAEALQILTHEMLLLQETGKSVVDWPILGADTQSPNPTGRRIRHLMNTDIYVLDESDSIAFAIHIMKWKQIHHLPVIRGDRELVGLISWTDIRDIVEGSGESDNPVKDLMKKILVSATEDQTIDQARKLMEAYGIHSLPIVQEGKLVGIFTSNDL